MMETKRCQFCTAEALGPAAKQFGWSQWLCVACNLTQRRLKYAHRGCNAQPRNNDEVQARYAKAMKGRYHGS